MVNVGANLEVAMSGVMDHQRVYYRVAFVEGVIRFWEPIFLWIADKPFQDRPVDAPFEPHGQFDRAAQCISGAAKDIFGHKIVAAPHRDVAALAMMDRINRDIATRVSRTDDEHTFARELRCGFVLGGMHDCAVELTLKRWDVGGA